MFLGLTPPPRWPGSIPSRNACCASWCCIVWVTLLHSALGPQNHDPVASAVSLSLSVYDSCVSFPARLSCAAVYHPTTTTAASKRQADRQACGKTIPSSQPSVTWSDMHKNPNLAISLIGPRAEALRTLMNDYALFACRTYIAYSQPRHWTDIAHDVDRCGGLSGGEIVPRWGRGGGDLVSPPFLS